MKITIYFVLRKKCVKLIVYFEVCSFKYNPPFVKSQHRYRSRACEVFFFLKSMKRMANFNNFKLQGKLISKEAGLYGKWTIRKR